MLATDLAYYLARKGVCRPIVEWVTPRQIAPENFENGGFTPKTHQTFSVHNAPEKFEMTSISGHFEFVFEEISIWEITWLSWRHCFLKNLLLPVECSVRRIMLSFQFLRLCVARSSDLFVLERPDHSVDEFHRWEERLKIDENLLDVLVKAGKRHNFSVRWFVLDWTMRNIANHIFRFRSVKLMVCPVLQFMLRKPKAVHWTNSLWRTWSKSGELHGLKLKV